MARDAPPAVGADAPRVASANASADAPIEVPRVLPIVDPAFHESRGFRPLLAVEQLIEAGAPLIWWRDAEQRTPLAALAERVPLSRILLSARVLTSPPRPISSAGMSTARTSAPDPPAGLHWGGEEWRAADALPGAGLRGASAHSLADLAIAVRLGCAYATLSPIFATDSKPGYGPALGLAALRDAATQCPDLPLLALGGASLPRLPELSAAGAHGVAALGAFACAQPGEVWRAWRDAWG